MTTETQFPLPPGSEVSLKCSTGFTLTGDNIVTCVKGTQFSFNQPPVCALGMVSYLDKVESQLIAFTEIFGYHCQTTLPLFFSDQCDALPNTPHLETEASFPVQYSTEIKLFCKTGYHLSGDVTITCIKDNSFRSLEKPSCNPS